MKFYCRTFLICLSLIFTGCASTLPTLEGMRQDTADFQLPKLPDDNKAMVYVVRPSSLGWLVRFNVFVDNKQPESEVGYTRGGEYIFFEVEPGEHQILSNAENWAEINISAKAGDILFINQEPAMGVVMARNTLSHLQTVEGTYHVKHLELGTLAQDSEAPLTPAPETAM